MLVLRIAMIKLRKRKVLILLQLNKGCDCNDDTDNDKDDDNNDNGEVGNDGNKYDNTKTNHVAVALIPAIPLL